MGWKADLIYQNRSRVVQQSLIEQIKPWNHNLKVKGRRASSAKMNQKPASQNSGID